MVTIVNVEKRKNAKDEEFNVLMLQGRLICPFNVLVIVGVPPLKEG